LRICARILCFLCLQQPARGGKYNHQR
jgi:hypothetical protein